MPIYEYECWRCGRIIEATHSVSSCPSSLLCECGGKAGKVLSLCAPHTDHPLWINNHLRDTIQVEGEKPIESRKELDAYTKEKGMVPRC